MMILELTDQEVNQLMNIIGNTRDFPWTITNPLLMKIGDQAKQFAATHQADINPGARKKDGSDKPTNSGEMPINTGEMKGH